MADSDLVGVSDIFNFFLLEEGPRHREGRGIGFFIENRRGGVLQDRRGRGAGRESAANWGFFFLGGGLIIFFGAEMSTKVRAKTSTTGTLFAGS